MFKNIPSLELWQTIMDEASLNARQEPELASYFYANVLSFDSLAKALAAQLAQHLACKNMSAITLNEVIEQVYKGAGELVERASNDIQAYFHRDPACEKYLTPLIHFKGFQALQCHRVNHTLWQQGRKNLAYYLQSRAARVFSVDIHPAARIGSGVMIDHATGLVIGETSVIGDNVSMLHSVTFGGSGTIQGDRHPKVADGVLIGAGAKLLGNIQIGKGAKIAAGSVVVESVDAYSTVAGVPAKVVGRSNAGQPAFDMQHNFD